MTATTQTVHVTVRDDGGVDRGVVTAGLEDVSADNALVAVLIPAKPLASLAVGEITHATDRQHARYTIERTR